MYRILVATDLHKKAEDPPTIKGYCLATTQVQLDLLNIIKEKEITHFIDCGDWYDRGFGAQVGSALASTEMERIINKMVNGNFYHVVGNHLRLTMDSNPELYLMQPNETFKSRFRVLRREPVMKSPRYLLLGDVQISLIHNDCYHDYWQNYIARKVSDDIKYHIGIYHTASTLPRHLFETYGELLGAGAMEEVYKDIDYAIFGHIHTSSEDKILTLESGKKVRISVPGSLTATSADQKADGINLPIITINDDGSIEFEKVFVSRHNELLTFKKTMKNEDEKFKSLSGNNLEDLYDDVEKNGILYTSEEANLSLLRFAKYKNFTDDDIELLQSVIEEPSDVDRLIEIHRGELL